MTIIYRIIGTALVFVGALLILKLGFHALSALDLGCKSALPLGVCRAIWLLLSSLLVFLAFFCALLLTNKIWGRNFLKPRPG
jgi:hypothetical protein